MTTAGQNLLRRITLTTHLWWKTAHKTDRYFWIGNRNWKNVREALWCQLALGKDGCQWYGDCADVHEEEESVEKSSDKSPVSRYSVLSLGVVQSTEINSQVAMDICHVAFQTSTCRSQSLRAMHQLTATVQCAAVVDGEVAMWRRLGRRRSVMDNARRRWLRPLLRLWWRWRARFIRTRQMATRVCIQKLGHAQNVRQTIDRQLQQLPTEALSLISKTAFGIRCNIHRVQKKSNIFIFTIYFSQFLGKFYETFSKYP